VAKDFEDLLPSLKAKESGSLKFCYYIVIMSDYKLFIITLYPGGLGSWLPPPPPPACG
jgi:hypothetical protein